MVVSAVVLGPGTITVASRIGCRYGYGIGWVVLLAAVLMTTVTIAALVAGVRGDGFPGKRLRRRFGAPATIAVGVVLFLIVALFQSSNNRALLLAAEYFWPGLEGSQGASIAVLLGFNALVIAFFLFARDIYRLIESAMLSMVGLMILCFVINAFVGQVEPLAAAKGLVPTRTSVVEVWQGIQGDIRALMATTFSVAGAFYQCYLVRERRWTVGELRFRRWDTAVGIGTLGLLTMLVMWTAAAGMHGKVDPQEVKDIATLADSLRPTFGAAATAVFAIGILAGAVSSFIGNALIGGTILSDCLGLGGRASQVWPRRWTVAALLVGGAIASMSVLAIESNINFIVIAQGLTTLGLPVMSLALLYLLVESRATALSGGEEEQGMVGVSPLLLIGMVVGVIVTCLLAAATVANLLAKLQAG